MELNNSEQDGAKAAAEAAWKSRVGAQTARRKAVNYLSYALCAVMLVCLATAIAMVAVWIKKDDLSKFGTYKKTLDTVRSLITTFFVLGAVNVAIKYAGGTVLTLVSYNDIKRDKFDVKAYVKKNLESLSSSEMDTLDYFLTAVYWEENPNDKIFEFIKSIVCTAAEVLTAVYIGYLTFYAIIRPTMNAGKLDMDLEQVDVVVWCVMVIGLVVSFVLETVFDLCVKRKIKKWLYEFLEIKEQK